MWLRRAAGACDGHDSGVASQREAVCIHRLSRDATQPRLTLAGVPAPPPPPPPGHCAGQVEGSVSPSPLPAHVRLNFSCNVVVVQRAEVLEAYERAVNVFGRPIDPDDLSGARQVRTGARALCVALLCVCVFVSIGLCVCVCVHGGCACTSILRALALQYGSKRRIHEPLAD